GIKLLRTCKQLREEGAAVLYGSNTFDFSTQHAPGQPILYDEPHRIPGYLTEDGEYPTSEQILQSIENLFVNDQTQFKQPKFLWRDPLTKFMTKTGRYNAGLIKSIRLNGTFKDGTYYECPLAQTLPMYALILQHACQSLRKVTLQAHLRREPWPHRADYNEGEPDKEIIDDIVGRFVESLPQLSQLCLGFRGDFHGDEMSPTDKEKEKDESVFGEALRWVDIVKKRAGNETITFPDAARRGGDYELYLEPKGSGSEAGISEVFEAGGEHSS
ncbi:uncharacterized protein LY89DRAFT_745460, partial [Mollisia scopiformis]